MAENTLSYKDLYEAISDLRRENNERFDKVEAIFVSFHKEEFSPLKEQVGKIWTYGSFGVAVVSLAFSMAWDWVKIKFFRNI